MVPPNFPQLPTPTPPVMPRTWALQGTEDRKGSHHRKKKEAQDGTRGMEVQELLGRAQRAKQVLGEGPASLPGLWVL